MQARILISAIGFVLLAACGTSREAASPAWGARASDDGGESAAEVVATHKAGAYEALAEMHRYEATGNDVAMRLALDRALEHVRALTDLGLDETEMRELYRSVVSAYDQHYGADDTLTHEYGDVFALRDNMFDSLNELDEPLAEDVALPEVERLGGTIPMTSNRLVAQSIEFLQRSPQRHVYRWMVRSGTYFPMIESVLREEGVPDELKYLATIESGLNPRARSRAGAGGMWQFMPTTGRAYGLEIDRWVDERSDPEESTRAAARHLRDLYEQFDDWLLALAAYNCGPSRVLRAIGRFEGGSGREASFWDIYDDLPRETRNYVPMFIAARMVMTDPTSFGLSRVEPGPAYDYDVVEVEGPMDLRAAADLAGAEVDELRDLNPEIRQAVIPASSYSLRVPSGLAHTFNQAYAALPESKRIGGVEHRVVRGESLIRIARHYGTTADALRAYNNISGSLIHPGDVLIVPVRPDQSESYAPPVVRASYEGGSRRPAEQPRPATAHVVRRGENLTVIAARYGVTVSSLRAWNGLSSSRIHPGQRLELRGTSGSGSSPAWIAYYVQRGDTLIDIADRYDATPADIRKWNALSSDFIRVGQKLAIYAR